MEDVRTEDKTGNQREAFIFKLDYNQSWRECFLYPKLFFKFIKSLFSISVVLLRIFATLTDQLFGLQDVRK